MIGLAGLRGQVVAGPLPQLGNGLSPRLVKGPNLSVGKLLRLTQLGGSLDTSTTSNSATTSFVTIAPMRNRRGEQFRGLWRQISGIRGEVSNPNEFVSRFHHSDLVIGSHPILWQFGGYNQFGDAGILGVSYTVTRTEEPPPALNVSVSPSTLSAYRIDGPPGRGAAWTDFATVHVVGGSGQFTYSWGASASGVGVSISGQGTGSASFGADIPDQSHFTGVFSVTVIDMDSGASGQSGGTLQFVSTR